MSAEEQVFLRIEKGHVDPAELAVLTALLYPRSQVVQPESPPSRPTARWRRLERHRAFGDPRAWTTTGH
ncbi:acyl-CoA carboxylase subunit epsilon [Nocardia sp. NPDC004860]|uniref:acyl-CoA carboxylase subunit epsilon n=1 Tax=Nocardia sp. NPDC004860 TaxID=3154557 RepID=UPI00339EAB72